MPIKTKALIIYGYNWHSTKEIKLFLNLSSNSAQKNFIIAEMIIMFNI